MNPEGPNVSAAEGVDKKKLGQNFANLAKDGKFSEMLIFAKQLNLPKSEISEALSSAVITLDQQYGLDAIEPIPGMVPMKIGERGGQMAMAAGAAGTIAGFPGTLVGLVGGMVAGMALGVVEMDTLKRNIGKVKEAKEWIESQP